MRLSLGDQVLSTAVAAQKSIGSGNRVSYTGTVTGRVVLDTNPQEQYLTCIANIQHGAMPTQEAGLAVIVNYGMVLSLAVV